MIASCASADRQDTAPPPATLEPLPATSRRRRCHRRLTRRGHHQGRRAR
ncbi:hypothetical protein I553_4122 [Mycobacterium xenopi 4042]|uniref:Uncharacterized protein n=1 Tax=Mycobacterium xenopi 4042 TaxID=1299334 RepID=X8AEC5_MYCXE|nr:hypothetical protein I553_4122 [Mycobacterium xenopi 4042]